MEWGVKEIKHKFCSRNILHFLVSAFEFNKKGKAGQFPALPKRIMS